VAAGAVHLLAERGLIDLHAPVSKYWPEFAVNGKEMITVAQVLNHQAGLANVGMNEMSRDPYVVCDSGVMLNILANSTPEHVPGEETKYHYLTFGWLVDGIVRGVTGTSLRDFVNDNIGKELSIEKEFMIGVPAGSEEDRAEVVDRVACLVLGKMVMPKAPAPPAVVVAAVVVEKDAAKDTLASKPSDATAARTALATAAVSLGSAGTSDHLMDTTTEKKDSKTTPLTAVQSLPIQSETNKETQSFEKRPPSGPSMLMNPTFFNNPRIREASIPSANGHFSARALAKFYSTTQLHTPKESGSMKDTPAGLRGEKMLQGGGGSFSYGFQLFPVKADEGILSLLPSILAKKEPAVVDINTKGMSFGHGGLGGSIALCRPDPKRKLAIAITLNRLSFTGKSTGDIMRAIYLKLGEPIPVAYAKKE
jgi:aarF domain-containing kinase